MPLRAATEGVHISKTNLDMYIRGFDGLRAIAVILVVLTHKTAWGEDAQVGFAGVWIFFLLSGFLIIGQLNASRLRIEACRTTLRQEAASFWIKRAMRIFPAYFTLLALVVPFYVLKHGGVTGLPYHLTYLSNVFFQMHPSEFLTTFAHFWSLAVEEQFYIFFAPLLLLVPSRHAAHACWAVVIASLLRRFWMSRSDVAAFAIYIDSLVNFGLLGLGGVLYLGRDAVARGLRTARLDRPWTGWAALLLTIACPFIARLLAGTSLPRLQAIYTVGVLAVALLLFHVYRNQRSMLTNLLEYRPVVAIGRISYGLYLYNDYVKPDLPTRLLRIALRMLSSLGIDSTPVDRLLGSLPLVDPLLRLVGLIVCFCVTVALARASWVLIESPALRLRARLLSAMPMRTASSPSTRPLEIAPDHLGEYDLAFEAGRLTNPGRR